MSYIDEVLGGLLRELTEGEQVVDLDSNSFRAFRLFLLSGLLFLGMNHLGVGGLGIFQEDFVYDGLVL